MSVALSQTALRLDLEWEEGDPVSLMFVWPDEDLSGTYIAPIRDAERDGNLIDSLDVTTNYVPGVGTEFSLTRFDSTNIPRGRHWWSLTEVGGVTRLTGRVEVGDGRQAITNFAEIVTIDVSVTTEVTDL